MKPNPWKSKTIAEKPHNYIYSKLLTRLMKTESVPLGFAITFLDMLFEEYTLIPRRKK